MIGLDGGQSMRFQFSLDDRKIIVRSSIAGNFRGRQPMVKGWRSVAVQFLDGLIEPILVVQFEMNGDGRRFLWARRAKIGGILGDFRYVELRLSLDDG